MENCPPIEDMRRVLIATAQEDDLDGTPALYSFPSGHRVKGFRMDPMKSLEELTDGNHFAAALTAYQEGNPAPLQKFTNELMAIGIRLEIRNYPGSPVITGIALVSESFDDIEWLRGNHV